MPTNKELAAIAGCHPSTILRRRRSWPQDRLLESPRRNESKWVNRTRPLVFRTDFETHDEVTAYAKENKITFSEAVRCLVEFGLEEVRLDRETYSPKRQANSR